MGFWHSHNSIRTNIRNFWLIWRNGDIASKRFAEEELFLKKVLFSDFSTEPCIVFKGGFEIAEIFSLIISEVWRCKSIVFDMNLQTKDPFREGFVLMVVQLTLICFYMWFVDSLKDLHQMLKSSRKINSNFFDMNLPKERSVQKKFLFPVLRERLLIYKYCNWAQTVLLSKYQFNSENIMYRVWCDFAKEGQRLCHIRDDLSRRYFRLRRCSKNVVLFSNTVFENAQALTSNVKKIWGKIKNFSTSICKGTLFKTVFVFSALPSWLSTWSTKWFWEAEEQHVQKKNFSCRAIEACMFSNVVHVHSHENFCGVVRNKTAFSEVNLGRNNLFISKLYLIMLNV